MKFYLGRRKPLVELDLPVYSPTEEVLGKVLDAMLRGARTVVKPEMSFETPLEDSYPEIGEAFDKIWDLFHK